VLLVRPSWFSFPAIFGSLARLTNMPVKPACLCQGDTVGVVAPASAPADPGNVDIALSVLEQMGFKPRAATHLRKRWGFLAGTDQQRAEDLMEVFRDKTVKAIICLRGGYGAARVLPLLDYKTIQENPKILVGYSDITSLHCALLAKADLITFHGPMLNSDFLKRSVPAFTRQSLLRTLTRPSPAGSLCQGYNRRTVKVLAPGKATGCLIGGNLSILCASLATPYQPSFKKAILFLEDLREEPYRFDRMLTQLLNSGLLAETSGVALGINKNCKDPKAKRCTEYRQTLEDVLKERLLPLNKPVVMGLPFGHVRHNATLPVGVKATLDADIGDLQIDEPAVL
jgi:muramoyltetrapeptide carboxypeptidase